MKNFSINFNGISGISITAPENTSLKFFEMVKDQLEETLFTEDVDSAQIEVDYCLATDFWRLPPKTKLLAKILRKRLFGIKSLILHKIEQSANAESLILSYSRTKNSNSPISFIIPETIKKKGYIKKVPRRNILPEESLTPWYYHRGAESYKAKLPIPAIKEQACGKEKNLNTGKTQTGKGRPPKNKKDLFLFRLSDYLSFSYSNDFYTQEDIDSIGRNCSSHGLRVSFEALKKHVAQCENICLSEFIREQSLKLYKDFITENIKEKANKEARDKIDLESYTTWNELKKDSTNKYLYKSLLERSKDDAFLKTEEGQKWKEKIKKLNSGIKDDFSNFEEALNKVFNTYPLHALILTENPKINEFYASIPCNECDLSRAIPLPKLDTDTDTVSPNQKEQKYELSSFNINEETSCLDNRYNYLTAINSKQQRASYQGILIPTMVSEFSSFAITMNFSTGIVIGDGVKEIGIIKAGIDVSAFWALLRTEAIRNRINQYFDPYIKEKCYRSIFDRVELSDVNINDLRNSLTILCFELAQMISCNLFPEYLFLPSLAEKMKGALSAQTGLNYYTLQHKINAITGIRNNKKKTCLIVYGPQTAFAKDIKIILPNDKLNIEGKRLVDIRAQVAEHDICLIALDFENLQEIEIARSILKIVTSSHLLIEQGQETTLVNGNTIPVRIRGRFISESCKELNYCNYASSDATMRYNIDFLIKKASDSWNIYEDFLIGIANCNRDDFKLLPCAAGSKAKRSYSSKEFAIFENLKVPIMKKALSLQREKDQAVIDPEKMQITILQYFENNIAINIIKNTLSGTMSQWNDFRKKYRDEISERKLKIFVKNNSENIDGMQYELPESYKLNKIRKHICDGTWDEYQNSKEFQIDFNYSIMPIQIQILEKIFTEGRKTKKKV